MKQVLCIVLAAAFVLFAGCAKQSNEQYNSVNFYYKTDPIDYESDSGIISAETRLFSGPNLVLAPVPRATPSGQG